MTDDAQTLAALRAEIDALDDALHDSLMRRAAVVQRLAQSGAKSRVAALRPGREATILRRLLARHHGPLRRAVLIRFWREIFASSLSQQVGFTVAAAPETISEVLKHFGPAVQLQATPEPLALLEAGQANVAGVPWPGAWWASLPAGRVFVIALLPFWREAPAAREAVLLAPAPADPSGRDATLIRANGSPPPGAREWARQGDLVLAELPGHIPLGDARLGGADCLGHYALPETA
jgi:chorismate mutase